MSKLYPIILSGGSGSRLWPLSRESYPKQLLPYGGGVSLLQATALRVLDPQLFHPLSVIANADHRFLVAEQLREIGALEARILLEAAPRNTAPAIALGAALLEREDPDAVLLVLPSGHLIDDTAGFRRSVAAAAAAAGSNLLLLAAPPSGPETSFGYVRPGAIRGASQAVDAFIEKPDRAVAEDLLAQGWFWNTGIFVVSARRLMEDLARHAPTIHAAARAAVDGLHRDLDFWRVADDGFADCSSVSIDRALLEKTDCAAMALAGFDWRPVDDWSALWGLGPQDEDQNVRVGDVMVRQTAGSYLRSEGPLVAAIDVQDLVVVATPDVVLVTRRDSQHDVASLVTQLRTLKHHAATQTRRTHRPWGWFESLSHGDRFQVKRIAVYPGARLSLQKHAKRAEHWVVVDGEADVHLDGRDMRMAENQSVYIPQGSVHRLSNPGTRLLMVVEVQSGDYLGEDDIVRLDDLYART